MDSGPALYEAEAATAPGTDSATAELNQARARRAGQVVAARNAVLRAQDALAAAEERLQRAQNLQRQIQERRRNLEQIASQERDTPDRAPRRVSAGRPQQP